MAGSIPDEDESVLSLSQQTRRPLDTALRQQRIRAWSPYLDPWWCIAALLAWGGIFVGVGYKMLSLADSVVEERMVYDKWNDPAPLCGINSTVNADKECSLSFVAPQDMEPPILVHYELTNFYQNHRDYVKSLDTYQLKGSTTQTAFEAEFCEPLNILGGIRLNPCGFIANTLFNDVFSLTSGEDASGLPLVMQEQGIAWESDLKYKFAQPDGFRYEVCEACNSTCCEGDDWSCQDVWQDPVDGTCYRYYYPDDNTTQYLYETYPMVVNPIEGVTNEHFVVWMRVAALPTFRKLYGYIEQRIPMGTVLNFTIRANYEVESFRGSKALIISTNNIFGGKNEWLGKFYISMGYFCLGCAVLFGLKQTFRPRKVADKKYLHVKQD